MCETSLRAHKSKRRLFKLDLFSLWYGWARYRLAAASSQNDDVMVSVFAKCKYQTGKELCSRNQCSSWSEREENKNYREGQAFLHFELTKLNLKVP